MRTLVSVRLPEARADSLGNAKGKREEVGGGRAFCDAEASSMVGLDSKVDAK